jgi:hypothetical protein
MVPTDGEKQTTSVTLIGDYPKIENDEVHSCSHRLKHYCSGKYLINIGIPIIIVIVMIILLLLFREKNRRCGIFYDSQHCKQTHDRSN